MIFSKKTLFFVVTFFLLVLFFSGGRASFVRDQVISRTASFSSLFSRGGAVLEGYWDGTAISLSNDRIRLFTDATELFSLRKENEALRVALRIGTATQKKVIPASITGVGREIGDEYILIDKGAEEGVGHDFLVLESETLLIGKVIEVFSHASRVRLLSSPQEIVEVLILPSGIRAVSRGMQSGELSLDLVPRESVLAVGDVVVTSERSAYGKDWVVGELLDIRAADNEVFQAVSARHLFDPFSDSVFVVIP
ncbi:MAG: rod shape-determining protein MreC [bacterium]|nr:rod shape-determining protein MreC [bacterium]